MIDARHASPAGFSLPPPMQVPFARAIPEINRLELEVVKRESCTKRRRPNCGVALKGKRIVARDRLHERHSGEQATCYAVSRPGECCSFDVLPHKNGSSRRSM